VRVGRLVDRRLHGHLGRDVVGFDTFAADDTDAVSVEVRAVDVEDPTDAPPS